VTTTPSSLASTPGVRDMRACVAWPYLHISANQRNWDCGTVASLTEMQSRAFRHLCVPKPEQRYQQLQQLGTETNEDVRSNRS
jgi:hypothetical protein